MVDLNLPALTLPKIVSIDGTIDLPGSKSISNRLLMLAALARGDTYIIGLQKSDDIFYMLQTLTLLGISYQLEAYPHHYNCLVKGNGGKFSYSTDITLFAGNAGTVIRPLVALLSLGKPAIVLSGNSAMMKRPIAPLVEALQQGGASIDYLLNRGYLPLKINGGFKGGRLFLPGHISSQFLTALLFAAVMAEKKSIITLTTPLISAPYVEMTIKLMALFGVQVKRDNENRFHIASRQRYVSPGSVAVEGDATAATYFIAAAAIKGGQLTLTNLGKNSIQGDIGFIGVLQKMGADITVNDNHIICTKKSILTGIDIDMGNMPDAAMTLAITALFARTPTTIRNIYNWQLKECDRLTAMANELRKSGAQITQGVDFIHIVPPKKFANSATISTYDDHRIAMNFALLSLSPTCTTILQPSCVTKTYPHYFHHFLSIGHTV